MPINLAHCYSKSLDARVIHCFISLELLLYIGPSRFKPFFDDQDILRTGPDEQVFEVLHVIHMHMEIIRIFQPRRSP